MSTGVRLTLRTYVMYLADALLCALFMLWFTDWIVVQSIVCLLLLVGFGMMCYNEGGWNGEKDVTLDRTAEKRIQEGKMDESKFVRVFNKKNAVICFLAASLPLFVLAAVNLAVSPNYPQPDPEQIVTEAEEADPFFYDEDRTEKAMEAVENPEPAGQMWLRIISRLVFVPLLPLYTLLEGNQTLLYALFLPFSFVLPACTAVGYLHGPRIREKKIEEIARGKVRRRKGLLVGESYVQNQHKRAPKAPKPKV